MSKPYNSSNVHLWASEHEMYVNSRKRKRENLSYNYTSLNGRLLFVPDNMLEQFQRAMAQDLKERNHLYWCEVVGNLRKPVFDLDFVGPAMISKEFIKEILHVLIDCIWSFYPNEKNKLTFSLIVLFPDNIKRLPCVNGKDQIKCPFHVIGNNLVMNVLQNQSIRQAFVSKCEQKWPRDPTCENPWTQVIDDDIYRSNSLRMVGNRKMVDCKCKKNRKKGQDVCDICENNSGKIDEGRAYWPWMVLDHFGNEDNIMLQEIQTDYFKCVQACSMRIVDKQSTPGFVIPVGAPRLGCDVTNNAQRKKQKVTAGATTTTTTITKQPTSEHNDGIQSVKDQVLSFIRLDVPTTTEFDELEMERALFDGDSYNPSKTKGWRVYLDEDDPRYQGMQEAIQKLAGPRYMETMVKSATTTKKRKHYICMTKGYGSSYCQNKGDDHNHASQIGFKFLPNGTFCQICFCPCQEKQRLHGVNCSEYESISRKIPTPSHLQTMLFPPSELSNAVRSHRYKKYVPNPSTFINLEQEPSTTTTLSDCNKQTSSNTETAASAPIIDVRKQAEKQQRKLLLAQNKQRLQQLQAFKKLNKMGKVETSSTERQASTNSNDDNKLDLSNLPSINEICLPSALGEPTIVT